MKIKKIILLLLILIILVNITSINATEDNNLTLDSTDENTIQINENTDNTQSQNNISSNEILSQNNNKETLSDFDPYYTQLTLSVNDTTDFNTTQNITVNMHISFSTQFYDGKFPAYNITIYENNTVLKTLNIGELNLPEVTARTTYNADVQFNYTVHDNSYLTTSLFGVYSNTLTFNQIKTLNLTQLNNNNILIDNTYSSNETWNNSIKSLQKAIEQAKNNGIINLNNINLIQDITETIQINKNITITGNNATIILKKTQSLLEINTNTTVTFINLTFIGNNNYIISNKGKIIIENCTFKDNSLGLIDNNGELEINNCEIQDMLQVYQDRPTTTTGLINNNGKLKITNTIFKNNKNLPYNQPIETTTLKGIIYNTGNSILNNVNFTNINYRIIYNDNGTTTLNNTLIYNIITASTQAVYSTLTNQEINSNYTYSSYQAGSDKTSMDGGAIYNNNNLTILNSILNQITGGNGGTIYNTGTLTIENTIINKTTSINHYGGAIYNTGTITANNSTITQSKTLPPSGDNQGYGGGIYNEGTLNLNNTILNQCSGGTYLGSCHSAGTAICNKNIMNLTNCQITNSEADWGTDNGQGVIYNSENAKATITKTILKDNTLIMNTYMGAGRFYGIIKNDGQMKISGCIFDGTVPSDRYDFMRVEGSINIYNTGTITVMYSYLLNTKTYSNSVSFLYNTGSATVNYNFYCLTPSSTIRNANVNYYFTPIFEEDYYPIKLNENTNITLTLALTNGANTIEFDDWDKLLTPGLNATITTIDENGEYINITTLLKDKYTFNFNCTNSKAIYTIYANILNYKNTAIVDIGKEFSEMAVTYNNITYNDGNITFHVKVTGNLTVQPTGNVTFTYNNQKYTVNLTDGECNYTITETLDPANYTMRIDYNGDDEYFRIIKQYFQFSVYKIPTNVTITAPEVHYGETGQITITLTPDTAQLYGTFYLDGKAYKNHTAITGTQVFTLNKGLGTYNLTIIIDEDQYYTGCAASTLFTVSKWTTNMTIEAEDIKAGENATINITINPGDVRGEAILEINNVNQTIFINDTITQITLTNLENGTYHINVYYPGDKKYAPSNASATFSVSKITSQIEAKITYTENLTGWIEIQALPLNCTGEVAIYINNNRTIANLTNGSLNITVKFKRGTNYIYIKYNGDDTYSISTWNTTTYIEGKAILTLETTALEEQKTGYIRINLTDTDNNPYEYTNITVQFNNQTTTYLTNENGTVIIPVKLNTGTYTIKATYKNATLEKNITVKTLTTLTVNIPDINAADDLMAYATLTYDNSTITANITLEINNKYFKIVLTDGAGSRNLGEFTAGTYTYTATYTGTNNLALASVNGTFQVIKNNYKITGNANIVQYYGATKTYKIRLLNNNVPVKNEIITIKINKNTVKVKTDSNGYATLKLSLKAGKYTITSTYQNVKVSNKITVKKTLITKNKKIKKGKTLTYTAKLLNKNGKKLKGKKITFKINGKKYKAKTSKKGIAKIKIKNLKTGKYKIKTTYKKLKNTNKITIKK